MNTFERRLIEAELKARNVQLDAYLHGFWREATEFPPPGGPYRKVDVVLRSGTVLRGVMSYQLCWREAMYLTREARILFWRPHSAVSQFTVDAVMAVVAKVVRWTRAARKLIREEIALLRSTKR